jgi:excisionase family DNA binding protein
MNQDRITIQELSKRLYVSEQTIAKWAKDGIIPCVMSPSGRVILIKQEVEEWINKEFKFLRDLNA